MSASARVRAVFAGATRRYVIRGRIGAGSVAEVFAADVEGAREEVAIKVLRESFMEDAAAREAFAREAAVAATIVHPNVARIVEIGDSHRGPFVAMELLEGKPLAALLADPNGVPRAAIVRVLLDVLSGLEAAHARGLAHGDLSPSSIVIGDDGAVKVVDFGVAKAVGGAADTRTGILKNKIQYLAPEQLGDAPIDARADVRALGVVLWEALTRQKAFGKGGDVVILGRIANEELPSPRAVDPSTPEDLARVCAKAAARDPSLRYANAAEMRAALAPIASSFGEQGSNAMLARLAAGAPAPPSPPRSASRAWIYVVVALILLCLGIALAIKI